MSLLENPLYGVEVVPLKPTRLGYYFFTTWRVIKINLEIFGKTTWSILYQGFIPVLIFSRLQ